jgi:hypothetical protein
VTTTTPTTIRGVSLVTPLITRQGAPAPEVFEIVLSTGGIDFRRTERPDARLTWDSVSQWEIEEREGDVLLTLQRGDAATPLLIPDWSAADLATLLRHLTEQPAQARAAATPVWAKNPIRAKKPAESNTGDTGDPPGTRAPSRPARRLVSWKAVVAFVLLGVLASAVAIVLLQSAGIINWSFLGPTV